MHAAAQSLPGPGQSVRQRLPAGAKYYVQLLFLTALLACNLMHSMTFVSVAYAKALPSAAPMSLIATRQACCL